MKDRKVDYPVLNDVAVDRLVHIKELVREYINAADNLITIGANELYGQGGDEVETFDPWTDEDTTMGEIWERDMNRTTKVESQMLYAINELLEVA